MLTGKGEGRRLQYTNSSSSAIVSGDVVVLAKGIGIAVTAIAVGAVGTIEVATEHELAAKSGQAWSMGEQLYWDATNEELTSTASSHNKAGMAGADCASAAVLGRVILNRNVV